MQSYNIIFKKTTTAAQFLQKNNVADSFSYLVRPQEVVKV